jgi:hypothetical protein
MVTVHPDCGEPVILVGELVCEPAGGQHLCRDYVAWHLPPDPRDPSDLDVEGGWVPRRPAVVQELRTAA